MVYSTPDGKGGLGHPRVQFSVAQSFLKGEVSLQSFSAPATYILHSRGHQ